MHLQRGFNSLFFVLLPLPRTGKLNTVKIWCCRDSGVWQKGFHLFSGFAKDNMYLDSSHFNTIYSCIGFCQIPSVWAGIFHAGYLPLGIIFFKSLSAKIAYSLFLYRAFWKQIFFLSHQVVLVTFPLRISGSLQLLGKAFKNEVKVIPLVYSSCIFLSKTSAGLRWHREVNWEVSHPI